MMKLIAVIFLLYAVLFPSTASAIEPAELRSETAQELLLFYEKEDLVSVGFFPTEAGKAPGYSYIITEEQIGKSPARSLRDVIEMRVPGMTTGGHERHGPLIGTRGIFIDNNAKTMVMLDGQQINQRSHFGYTSGLLSPLLGDISQVEVTLGPGAILHGSGALNGFIDLIPKNGKDDPGWFAGTEYGFAEKLWKAETGYGGSYGNKRNYYLYAGAYGAEGYEPDTLYGNTKTFDIHSNGFEGGNYRFSAYWNHKDFNMNTFYYENNPYKNASDESGHFHQATLGIRPKYVFEINDTDSLEFIGSFLWFDHMSVVNKAVVGEAGGSERHWGFKNIYRTTRWKDHSLAAGFSFGEKRFYERDQFFSSDLELSFETLGTKWHERSVFAEDVFVINNRWTTSIGLRYDEIDLNEMTWYLWEDLHAQDPDKSPVKQPEPIKGHLSPRIATAYELDNETTVKASYQHGFRTPDAAYYELNLMYRDAAESLGIEFPALEIETLDSYELNLEKKVPDKNAKLNLSLFYNIFNHLLSWNLYKDTGLYTPEELELIGNAADPSFPPDKQLIGSFLNEDKKIHVLGGEISGTFQPWSSTKVRVSYGYVKSDADEMRYPSHQFKLSALHFLNDDLSGGLNYLYNSGYSESDLSSAHDIYRNPRHVVDASLNYHITHNASVRFTVNNIFENDVPPMVFEPDRLDRGGLGFDERRIYVAFRMEV